MKFIKLESRGGNYLVVAENVAWLRTAENCQASVGIIGGQPLLVVGSVEEVAAKILAGAAPDEPEAEATPPEPAMAAPASAQPASAPAVEAPPARRLSLRLSQRQGLSQRQSRSRQLLLNLLPRL